jgi:hypothetical protein
VSFQNKWSLKANFDTYDVTAFGESNKSYVAGIADAQGDFSGFYDDATVQTYTAATDGLARKMYLYPNSLTATQYWFGTVFVDFSVDGSTTDAVAVSASWHAASPIAKVG